MGVLKAKVGGVWQAIGQGFANASPGYIGHALLASDQTIAGTSAVDLTGMAVTFTADPTHRYKTTVVATVSKTTATGNVNIQIADAANANITTQTVQLATGDIGGPVAIAVETGLSGTQTRKARASTNVAGLVVNGGATYKTIILVEDITAAFPGSTGTPRGYVGMGTGGGQTFGTTQVDITGATVSWTADPTRRYKTTLFIPRMDQFTSNGVVSIAIANAANGVLMYDSINIAAGGFAHAIVMYVESGISGAQTRKGRLNTNAGTLNTLAGNQFPFILVEDIGGT